MRRGLNRPITLKHLLMALALAAGLYLASEAYADHVAIRAIVVQLNDVITTVNQSLVGLH